MMPRRPFPAGTPNRGRTPAGTNPIPCRHCSEWNWWGANWSWPRSRRPWRRCGRGRAACSACSARAAWARPRCSARCASAPRPPGLLVLDGRGAEHERDVPFGVVVAAFDDHVATLHAAADRGARPGARHGAPRRRRTAGRRRPPLPRRSTSASTARCARCSRLLARERPVALVLDDLHWADDASIEFVLHLLRRPPRAPHLLVARRCGRRPAPRLLEAARAAPGASRWRSSRSATTTRCALLARRRPTRTAPADRARGARQPAVPATSSRASAASDGAARVADRRRRAASWPRWTRTRGRCWRAPPSPATRSIPSWPRPPPGCPERRRSPRSTSWSRSTSSAPRGTGRALRVPPSARAPGRLRRRAARPGALPPTSAPRPRSERRGAGRAVARPPRRARRAAGRRGGDRAAARGRGTPRPRRPRHAAHWYAAALRLCRTTAAQRAALLRAAGRSRWRPPGGSRRARAALLEVLALPAPSDAAAARTVAAARAWSRCSAAHPDARRRLLAELDGASPSTQADTRAPARAARSATAGRTAARVGRAAARGRASRPSGAVAGRRRSRRWARLWDGDARRRPTRSTARPPAGALDDERSPAARAARSTSAIAAVARRALRRRGRHGGARPG